MSPPPFANVAMMLHSSSSQPNGELTSSPHDEAPCRPPIPLWKWIGAGMCGTLLLVAVPVIKQRIPAMAEDGHTSEAITVLPVETVMVDPVDGYDVARSYTGELAAQRSSNLGFERSGQLMAVMVDEGDRVSPGTPLARLDTRNLEAQRRQLTAEKARAMAQLAELEAGPRREDIDAAKAAVRDVEQQLLLQQAQYSRRKALYDEGAISAEELDEFSFGRDALQARLDQARSVLAELENGTRRERLAAQVALVQQLEASIAEVDITLAKSTLRAPFAGIISTQTADEGTVLAPGQSVLSLVEAARPEVRIGIPTDAAAQLRIGEPETINMAGQTYPAQTVSVLPDVDGETRTQTVVFRLEPGTTAQITPGQTARVALTERVPMAGYWVPSEALVQGIRGLWNCYVVVPMEASDSDASDANASETIATEPTAYIVEQKAVEILHQTGDRVLVRGTLQPGDRVVASGTHRLVPGQQVEPR